MIKTIRTVGLISVILMLAVAVQAQETCGAFFSDFLTDSAEGCADLANNSACIGYSPDSDAPFTQEALVPMSQYTLDGLTNADGTVSQDIAYFKTSALLPDNDAVLIAFGDVVITDNGTGVVTDTTVEIVANVVDAFSSPPNFPLQSSIVGVLNGNFVADAQTPDGLWLRVRFPYSTTFGQRTTAWVLSTDIEAAAGIADLAVIGADTYGLMQNFTIDTGAASSDCVNEPSSAVVLQGPEQTATEFVVNGTPITVYSTVHVTVDASGRLRISTLYGVAVVGTDPETVLPTGYTMAICLPDATDCVDEAPRPMTDTEIASLNALELIPENVLNYFIDLPVITCASGRGEVVCEIQLPESLIGYFDDLCSTGALSSDVCSRYGL